MSNSNYREKARKWMADYYGQLEGATIKTFSIGVDEEMNDDYPTFTVILKDGTEVQIEISQDEEGNGPGFIFGLPLPNVRKLPMTGSQGYSAGVARVRLSDHNAETKTTKDGRIVAVVSISDKEDIQIGEDPDDPEKFAIWLAEKNNPEAPPEFVLPNLDEPTMIAKAEALIAGTEGVRTKLLVDHAQKLLAPQGGELWHSGGGIMLIIRRFGEIRIGVAVDDQETASYGLEVVKETDAGTDSLYFKEGLTPTEMVGEWTRQVSKYTS